MSMPFRAFHQKMTLMEEGKKYYLQHYLGGLKQLNLANVLTDSDGKILSDIDHFKWAWLNGIVKVNSSIHI